MRFEWMLWSTIVLAWIGGCARPAPAPATPQPISPGSLAAPPATRPALESVEELGTSVEGRPIRLHRFGQAPWPTLILGGIHGNEPTSSALCRQLIEYLRLHPEALGARCVAIIPEANPDGLAHNTRINKNRVDLNRNFPASNWVLSRREGFSGGETPASEPETAAILKAVERVNPARIVSVHSMARPCNNYDGPALALANRMAQFNHYAVKDAIGYPTPGSLGSWAGIDRKIPIITLELPSRTGAEQAWDQNRRALLSVIRAGEPVEE